MQNYFPMYDKLDGVRVTNILTFLGGLSQYFLLLDFTPESSGSEKLFLIQWNPFIRLVGVLSRQLLFLRW